MQVADLVAYLDAREMATATLVGISFGGVLAVETAARHPDRVCAIVAWEPPYIPLADADTRARIGDQADALREAYASGGPAAVTERFMRALGGDAVVGATARRRGNGSARRGRRRSRTPVSSASSPTACIASRHRRPSSSAATATRSPRRRRALAARIRGAQRATIAGFTHPSPITDPIPFAAAVRDALELRP